MPTGGDGQVWRTKKGVIESQDLPEGVSASS
jgi:hypothetical protein